MPVRMKRLLRGGLVRCMDANRWAGRVKRIADGLESKRLTEFLEGTDFAALDVSAYPRRCIATGSWQAGIFNMYFCTDILANIAYCLSRRELPYVEVYSRNGGGELWTQFLEQPYPLEQARRDDWGCATCDRARAPIPFPWFPTERDVRRLSKLFQPPVFALNPQVRDYVESEYAELFVKRGNPRVCGVLCRGTDYNYAKGHPTQPPVEDVIALVERKIAELRCDYIYLATEEYRTQEKFDRAFPGRVLINKRVYYDAYYEMKDAGMMKDAGGIAVVNADRENGAYLNSLEYLSSLVLLSRCQALIGGTCGGSNAALYMNGGKYEYWHLFNLGLNR